MVHAFHSSNPIHLVNPTGAAKPSRSTLSEDELSLATLTVQLPDPEDDQLPELEFWQQIDAAWQVCDRLDLQTEICRGRILRAVRNREKRGGDGRGTGFLNWLKDKEISKTQAYSLIELANSADALLEEAVLQPEEVNCFSKRAFIETARAEPEVQQMVSDLLKEPVDTASPKRRVTQRQVRQLQDEWTAISSDLLPIEIREKAANSTIPARYLTPLVREMEKLPEPHQAVLQSEVAANPDVDTIKQATAEARYLAKYLAAATQVQALNQSSVDLETALEEALRIGCLSSTADLVNQAAQLEQTMAKLYTTWRRLNRLAERVYLDSGASTPQLCLLLSQLQPLCNEQLELNLGDPNSKFARVIRLQISSDAFDSLDEPLDA